MGFRLNKDSSRAASVHVFELRPGGRVPRELFSTAQHSYDFPHYMPYSGKRKHKLHDSQFLAVLRRMLAKEAAISKFSASASERTSFWKSFSLATSSASAASTCLSFVARISRHMLNGLNARRVSSSTAGPATSGAPATSASTDASAVDTSWGTCEVNA